MNGCLGDKGLPCSRGRSDDYGPAGLDGRNRFDLESIRLKGLSGEELGRGKRRRGVPPDAVGCRRSYGTLFHFLRMNLMARIVISYIAYSGTESSISVNGSPLGVIRAAATRIVRTAQRRP